MPAKGPETGLGVEVKVSHAEQRFVAFGKAQENIRNSILQQPIQDIARGDDSYVAGVKEIAVAGVVTSDRIKNAIRDGVEAYVGQEKAISMWEQQWTRQFQETYKEQGYTEPLTDEVFASAKTSAILSLANRGVPLSLTAEQLSQITIQRSHGGFAVVAPPEVLAQLGGISCDTPAGEVSDPALVTEVISQATQFGFALSKSETAALPGGPVGGMDLIFVASNSTNIAEVISHEEGELLGMHIEEGALSLRENAKSLIGRDYDMQAAEVLSDMASRFEHPDQEAILGASGVTASYAKEHPREVAVLSLLHKRAEELIASAQDSGEENQVRSRVAQELRGAFLRPEQLLRVWYAGEKRHELLRQEKHRVQQEDFQKELYGEGLNEPVLLSYRNVRFMHNNPLSPTPKKRGFEWAKKLFKRDTQPSPPTIDTLSDWIDEINAFESLRNAMEQDLAGLPTNTHSQQRAKELYELVANEWVQRRDALGRVRSWEDYHAANAFRGAAEQMRSEDVTGELLLPWATVVGALYVVEDPYTPPTPAPGPAQSSSSHPIPPLRPNITVTRDKITTEVRDFITMATHISDTEHVGGRYLPLLQRTGVLARGNDTLEESTKEALRQRVMADLAKHPDTMDGGILTVFKDIGNEYLADEYLKAIVGQHAADPAEAVKKTLEFVKAPAPLAVDSREAIWKFKGARTVGSIVEGIQPPTDISETLLQDWEEQLAQVTPYGQEITPQDVFAQATRFIQAQGAFLEPEDRFTKGMDSLTTLMRSNFFQGEMARFSPQAYAAIAQHLGLAIEKMQDVRPYIQLVRWTENDVRPFLNRLVEKASDNTYADIAYQTLRDFAQGRITPEGNFVAAHALHQFLLKRQENGTPASPQQLSEFAQQVGRLSEVPRLKVKARDLEREVRGVIDLGKGALGATSDPATQAAILDALDKFSMSTLLNRQAKLQANFEEQLSELITQKDFPTTSTTLRLFGNRIGAVSNRASAEALADFFGRFNRYMRENHGQRVDPAEILQPIYDSLCVANPQRAEAFLLRANAGNYYLKRPPIFK